MRILLVSSHYLPTLGGVQTAVHALAQQFQAKGHAVMVVANRHPRTLPAQESLDGIPVQRMILLHPRLHHLRIARLDLFLGGLVYGPLTFLRLCRLFDSFQPDVVNLHHPDHPCLFVLGLHKRYGTRLVVSLHGDEILKFDQAAWCQRHLLRAVIRQADTVTACSEYLLMEAARIDAGVALKGHVVPNGVDMERFESRLDGRIWPRPFVFAAGRLTAQKGFDVLIAAFSQIAHAYPELSLIIAGEGEERRCLEAMVARLGLQKRVRLTGRITPEQLAAFLTSARVAVIPSRWEPFGIVALEAVAADVPIVASRVGGLPALLEGLSGVRWVTPGAVDDLAGGIAELIRHGSHQPGQNRSGDPKRADLLHRHQWPAIGREYLRLFGAEGET